MAKSKSTAKKKTKTIAALAHTEAKRTNIPTAEYQSMVARDESPMEARYPRGGGGLDEEKRERNVDLDPQLVWRGKDRQDYHDLVVNAPPLYIQEKIHPKALIDDLRRMSEWAESEQAGQTLSLFADFNGLPEGAEKTEFYQHEGHWQNRMILGDSLQVMASLAEREGLRGKVQCIYFDPPYGIKFNSNFQWSTTSRDVRDGKAAHITREPEQVKAFRDTWRDGIHSYLTYLRDRLTVARDLLTESGSIFVQIGDENVHRVRALMDEVFGDENFCSTIQVTKTGSQSGDLLSNIADAIIWYAKDKSKVKYRKFYLDRPEREEGEASPDPVLSSGHRTNTSVPFIFKGKMYDPGSNYNWKTHLVGMERLARANRLIPLKTTLRYARYFEDYPVKEAGNIWADLGGASDLVYVVQTATRVIQRCMLMATDPGDLVLDPTCGSGTTAYVAEQWGRRFITIDTSRVALALARARLMGARYPFYLLTDSAEGKAKEAELSGTLPSQKPTFGSVRHGFVYERVPHVTLKSIANNTEIDVLYEEHQPKVEAALAALNAALRGHKTPFTVESGGRARKKVKFDDKDSATFTMPSGEVVKAYELVEWEVPRNAPADWPKKAEKHLEAFWEARIARQKAIDDSIAAKAEYEYLYDKPYEDKKKVRVAGPFTVESLLPHRALGFDEDGELIDGASDGRGEYGEARNFTQIILQQLEKAGVQQAHKSGKIDFIALKPWPGENVHAEGRYLEGKGEKAPERRAAIFVGPEFGTVTRTDLAAAAREADEAGFDVLIACAFNYGAHASELQKLGRIPVMKARMNADLHMAEDLKNTGKGNLFVVFGEPDIELLATEDGQVQVKINGVDVFHPETGEVVSSEPDKIACWFIDTDYDEESFFVRHAYFLGAGDPYKSLKTTLKAEIDADAWATLNSDTSRPFPKPKSGRIAVKVINHLGDEVMKVFRAE